MLIQRNLSELLEGVRVLERQGAPEAVVRGIAYDSRQVEPGTLFAALEGVHTDGHRYVADALRRGASAVLHSGALDNLPSGAAFVRVADTRLALSPVSAAFYGHPSRNLTVIGVTGTDGKSTTVWLIHQLLEALGRGSGFISTVQVSTRGAVEKNPLRQSTPEAPEIHRLLAEMVEAGRSYAVVESTSHGLSRRTNRLGDVAYDVAVMTNVTHEHLEFHGTLEQYRFDKANLFRAASAFGVINLNDPHHDYFRKQSAAPVLAYGLERPEADLWAEAPEADARGTTFLLRSRAGAHRVRLNLPGLFNVENLLAALLPVMHLLDLSPSAVADILPELKPVRGRMEEVRMGQPFQVFVDYAHTPGAFEQVLPAVRRATPGRLTTVFGSAGERDLEKRPRLGEIAARYCDRVVLADEDPRGEDGLSILEQVAAGCGALKREERLFIRRDRREAIRLAFGEAREGDVVLLLGKGHESSIIYAEGPLEWDEAAEARQALREMGWSG